VRARTLLRRYLLQQRELGVDDVILDAMSAAEVRTALSSARATPREVIRPGAAPHRAVSPPLPEASDWRSTLRAVEASPASVPRPAPPVPGGAPALARAAPPSPVPGIPAIPGIVVGAGERELFGGPIAQATSIGEIADMVQRCTRCPLSSTATQGVPGEGSPRAELMCIGEAPGAQEDATGRPFVGQAGQLLTKILAAVNLSRDQVFIANVLKHRPPGNRNPRPEEVDACRPYLVRQIELIRPKVIVAFGTFAAQSLLETKLAIGKLRGQVHRYHGIPVIVTYHPAALLRNPAWKRPTWEDVQLARRLLDSARA
jgi:DNA polymerase